MSQPRTSVDSTFTFTISLKKLSIAILAVLLTVLGLTTWFYVSDQDTRLTLTYGSSLLAASVAVCALLYNAQVHRENKGSGKRSAAYRIIERWNDPALMPLKIEWRMLLSSLAEMGHGASAAYLNDNKREQALAVEFLSVFEDVAICVLDDTAEEGIINRFLGYHIPRSFGVLKPWIDHFRNTQNASDVYCETEKLVARWKESYGGF